jgi:hypothetical protein
LGSETQLRVAEPPDGAGPRLTQAQNLWIATVRPDGSPHLVPVWFVWHEAFFYICIAPGSVKAKNLELNDQLVVALEDGTNPLICEGQGSAVPRPWPEDVIAAFQRKYDWLIRSEAEYSRLIRVRPIHWVAW